MDRDMGRTDHYSLRLDGPAGVTGLLYHHMIDGYAKRYLCSFWLKTQGVRGAGPMAKLRYPWSDAACDTIETGLTGDNDWQEVSFVTTVPCITPTTYDASEFILQLDGTGTVWLDDVSLRPIEEAETIIERRPEKKATTSTPSAGYLLDLPCNEGEGSGCYDVSFHGNSAKLHGVTWTRTDKRAVLHFEEGAAVFVPNLSSELQPTKSGEYPGAGLTLEAWVRPAAGKQGGAVVGYFSSPMLPREKTGSR